MSNLKEFYKIPFVDLVYDIVRMETYGMDAIYADFIIQQVGVFGLNSLIEHKLVEGCGVVNGRKLYVLCTKNERV